jgi:hypothetical protein
VAYISKFIKGPALGRDPSRLQARLTELLSLVNKLPAKKDRSNLLFLTSNLRR